MKNKSKKGFTLVEIMIVVVIIGLLAALAVPAFQKVRENAIGSTLANDARQLSSAANQYFLENSKNSAEKSDLVGPGLYITELSSEEIVVSGPFDAGGEFTLSHPNYNNENAVRYSVDTGRKIDPETTE